MMAEQQDSSYSNPTEKKRSRVDSATDSATESKRVCQDPDRYDLHSPEANMIREDLLLGILDDYDEPEIQGLETVMKSFEDEILLPAAESRRDSPPEEDEEAAAQGSDLDEQRADLGYLLEASDDDLGLPPTTVAAEMTEAFTGRFDLGVGFDDEVAGYDSIGYGFGEETVFDDGDGGFLQVDGLFEHGGGPSEDGFLWVPETLPAL